MRTVCLANGLRSLSELARIAMRNFAAVNGAEGSNGASPPLITEEIRDLRDRVRSLSTELERLAERVSSTGACSAEN